MSFLILTKRLGQFQQQVLLNWDVFVSKIASPLSKKFEGTVVERAGVFLKNVAIDYKEVFVETCESARTKPKKAVFFVGGLSFLYGCHILNPDENSFRDELLICQHRIMLLSSGIRNTVSEKHLKCIETYYNEGRIRFFSLGILSVMWLDNYDLQSGLYEAHCKYLKPKILSYPSRIIDLGFLGNWWLLYRYMKDYDVNLEFSNS